MQCRAENPPFPQQPLRSAVLLLYLHESHHRQMVHCCTNEDTNTAYGVPIIDDKRRALGDVLTQYRSQPSCDEHDRNSERGPERQAWTAHPYTKPLAVANPSPAPVRCSSAWSTSSLVPRLSISVRGDDDEDGDGNQAVSEEYAFGSRLGLSMRARTDGNVYGSRENRSRGA